MCDGVSRALHACDVASRGVRPTAAGSRPRRGGLAYCCKHSTYTFRLLRAGWPLAVARGVAARHALRTHRCLSLSNERGGSDAGWAAAMPFGRVGNARSGAEPTLRTAERGTGPAGPTLCERSREKARMVRCGPKGARRRAPVRHDEHERPHLTSSPQPRPVIGPEHWSVRLHAPAHVGTQAALVGCSTLWGARSCTAQ